MASSTLTTTLQTLESALSAQFTDAVIKRQSQADMENWLDRIIKGKLTPPWAVLVVGDAIPDTELSDCCAELRVTVTFMYIRDQALSAAEKTAGYSRIEDWGIDTAVALRNTLWTFVGPLDRIEPTSNGAGSNAVASLNNNRQLPFYGVLASVEMVVAAT